MNDLTQVKLVETMAARDISAPGHEPNGFAARSYLIATTPHAGGDFLARVLRRSGLAGDPREYFTPTRTMYWHDRWDVERDWLAYSEFIDAARRNASSPNGVFGATLNWHQFAWMIRTLCAGRHPPDDDDPAALVDFNFGRPKYVFVRRLDVSRQAIDYYQTISLSRLELIDTRTVQRDAPVPTDADLAHVRWFEDLLRDHYRQWTRFFERSGIEPLEVSFEDLREDWRRVGRTVLAYLRIRRPPGVLGPVGRPPRPDEGWATTWAPAYATQYSTLAKRPAGRAWTEVDRLPGQVRHATPKTHATAGEKIRYSCVVDRPPRLQYQSLVWCITLLEIARARREQLVVHAVEGTSQSHLRRLRALDVEVVPVKRFDERTPYANKLRQLESQALRDADRVVLCDCDLAFCGDISEQIGGPQVGAKVVDGGVPKYHHWVELRRLAGLTGPLAPRRSTHSFRWTYANNLNGGLLVVPSDWLPPLADAWPRWLSWLFDLSTEFASRSGVQRYPGQVSFGLAALELALPVRQLPPTMNLSTIPPHDDPDLYGLDPLVVHYHSNITAKGLLKPTGVPRTDEAIRAVNRTLLHTEHRDLLAAALAEWREST